MLEETHPCAGVPPVQMALVVEGRRRVVVVPQEKLLPRVVGVAGVD